MPPRMNIYNDNDFYIKEDKEEYNEYQSLTYVNNWNDWDEEEYYNEIEEILLEEQSDYTVSDGEIVIGKYFLSDSCNNLEKTWLLFASVLIENFMIYEPFIINRFLGYEYNEGPTLYPKKGLASILKMKKTYYNNVYFSEIIDMTHWIRLIQRNWKRVIKERKQIYSINNHIMRKKLPINLPGLKGLLRGIIKK
jgi:hypothetical protein